MPKPVVAIVGRPNVGKSSLFNRIIGERLSITDDASGVTRDRIYGRTSWLDQEFSVIDTGGIILKDEPFSKEIRAQAELAMDMADVILFVVDGKDGLTTADREVATMLRRTGKPVILVVNKIDAPHKLGMDFYDFYELGLGEPIPVSAINMLNFGDVLDEVVQSFPKIDYDEDDDTTKIAVIGKPNVGKSSLINCLLGENRVIVSPIAGTTRDSIDTPFEQDGEKYILIDTAGIRRKSKVTDDIERYSVIRATAAVERCDVALLVIDAAEGLTEQDKKNIYNAMVNLLSSYCDTCMDKHQKEKRQL